jgi:hypothetical protein
MPYAPTNAISILRTLRSLRLNSDSECSLIYVTFVLL